MEADEWEEEERDRAQRKKLNQEFELFVKAIENQSNKQVHFETPFRDLGFYGTPSRGQVFLQPTYNCLVNLTDTPFFVMPFDDIEIVVFERIQVLISSSCA